LLFLAALVALTFFGAVGLVLARVPLPPAAFVPESTYIYDANGGRLAVLHGGENRENVDLEEVPEIVVQAVVAAEDQTFFRHKGLDPVGIARATWADIRAGSAVQGGSTITQQYVKNVYVGTDRTLWRKLKEAALAVKLERKLSKDEILERYLNTIYFGRGAYGVQAAAKAWFGRDVGELGLPEAAYLAGLIRAPETADVERDPERAEARRRTVLDSMAKEGYISAADQRAVERTPIESYAVGRDAAGPLVVGHDIGTEYFVEQVRRELVERFSSSTVHGGGLRVHTTLNPAFQQAAYGAAYGLLDQPDDPAAAVVVLDEMGAVRAMVGGRDWNQSKVNLAVGEAGGGGGRQAGSAFKPFVLAEAVRQGISVESSFNSPGVAVFPKANDGKDWRVTNYDRAAHGRINLIEATRVSSNTVYAQLVQEIGPAGVAKLAQRMGVVAELPAVNSITLGTPTVSVLDMATGYLTLARRGVTTEPFLITRVTTADGSVLFDTKPDQQQALSADQADVVNFVLEGVVRHGTGTGAAVGTPVAGKTGTTQSYGDAWFVGYTPKMSVAVWMGYAEGQARAMDAVRGQRVTGGSFPATIFQRFMVAAGISDHGGFPPVSQFPGQILGDRIPYLDPTATTTTPPTTTTEPTTTTSPPPPTTSKPPATTTTTKPEDEPPPSTTTP
jgi:penicillin-binding protein 1A